MPLSRSRRIAAASRIQRDGAVSAKLELSAVGGGELQPGRDAGSQRRLVGVDDGVGEAADARHHRRRAVAQARRAG